MIEVRIVKHEKCDNCGQKFNDLIYDCVYKKHFCEKCNNCKPEHPDKLIIEAFEKLTKKYMRRWF